jgi:hypothetical protein
MPHADFNRRFLCLSPIPLSIFLRMSFSTKELMVTGDGTSCFLPLQQGTVMAFKRSSYRCESPDFTPSRLSRKKGHPKTIFLTFKGK